LRCHKYTFQFCNLFQDYVDFIIPEFPDFTRQKLNGSGKSVPRILFVFQAYNLLETSMSHKQGFHPTLRLNFFRRNLASLRSWAMPSALDAALKFSMKSCNREFTRLCVSLAVLLARYEKYDGMAAVRTEAQPTINAM
jgi:hypothetical protein